MPVASPVGIPPLGCLFSFFLSLVPLVGLSLGFFFSRPGRSTVQYTYTRAVSWFANNIPKTRDVYVWLLRTFPEEDC